MKARLVITEEEYKAIEDARDMIGTAFEAGDENFIESYSKTHRLLGLLGTRFRKYAK